MMWYGFVHSAKCGCGWRKVSFSEISNIMFFRHSYFYVYFLVKYVEVSFYVDNRFQIRVNDGNDDQEYADVQTRAEWCGKAISVVRLYSGVCGLRLWSSGCDLYV